MIGQASLRYVLIGIPSTKKIIGEHPFKSSEKVYLNKKVL